MAKVSVHHSGEIKDIIASEDENLLHLLRKNGFELFSPCGGNGTCGKCKVLLKGEGAITSCLYKIKSDIEIVLPSSREAEILVFQNSYTVELPLNPGDSVHLSEKPFGVAIDIGTTSVVFYLADLQNGHIVETSSILNPQAKYGGDIISRINHCSLNPSGTGELQNEIVEAINKQLKHLVQFTGITKNDLVKFSVTGNTTMLHLLLGVSPASMGVAPYIPEFIGQKIIKGADLKFCCNPEAEVKIVPSISAFVGADIVAGMASLQPPDEIKNYLFIDIGTNGEMGLITPEKSYCCSTAAVPAFEGANITCGIGAVEGAISTYDSSGYTTIADSKPIGICGSGLIDIVATLVGSGTINSDGLMENDFIVVPANESATGKPIILTPSDVREVQLAKSSISAGIKIMVQQAGIEFSDIDALFLAGGFGNYINVENAIKIGLLPSEMEGKIITIGNSSGTGALQALKSNHFDKIASQVVNTTENIELSSNDDFTLEFAMNMMF
jgi:uncharacterized 2Fe-2S/4Fe-4S cluster protein (DUF4445 family)